MIGLPEVIFVYLIIIISSFSILPLILVANSKRVSGSTKALWVIIVFFLSWLGFIIFVVANPKKEIVQ